MAVCTYDNPATMARECWQDGRLLCSYSAELLTRKLAPWETQPIPPQHLFFGANIGPWKMGQLAGDRAAMESKPQIHGIKPE